MSEPQVMTSVPVTVPEAATSSCLPIEQNVISRPIATSSGTNPGASPAAAAFGLWMEEVHSAAEEKMAWLWHGYLAPGNITLLTSQWKTGKTTLLSVLLARLKEGGTLAGLASLAARRSSFPKRGWHTGRGAAASSASAIMFISSADRSAASRLRSNGWHSWTT